LKELQKLVNDKKNINTVIAKRKELASDALQRQAIIQTVKDTIRRLNDKDLAFAEKKIIIDSIVKQIRVNYDAKKMEHKIDVTFKINQLTQYAINNTMTVRRNNELQIKKEPVKSNILIEDLSDSKEMTIKH
jgi:hypothetical protein